MVLSWSSLATSNGSVPAYDDATHTCSGVYCHGATLKVPPTQLPAWSTAVPDWTRPFAELCSTCHGYPPPGAHPTVQIGASPSPCRPCHSRTVLVDGNIDLAGGRHINGTLDFSGDASGWGCEVCHGFPPATGAHLAHFALAGAASGATYGDTRILQDLFPGTAPTTAPASYAFGCGNCHPLDAARHMDGTVEVELHDAAAPAWSLKALASQSAVYDAATGTCSGVYCHSSGQQAPDYLVTPGWFSGTSLACDGCHSNPPRYASGGSGSTTANSHVQLSDSGREWGHFLGEGGPRHDSYHGGNYTGRDAAPITCQTCHYDTTDPANSGPSGFYYLDTTGAYQLPGGDPTRLTTTRYLRLQCIACHVKGGAAALGSGSVLPLRHVNGARDVVFDPRTTLPDIGWLPAVPNRPTRPYWESSASTSLWRGAIVLNGTTVSFSVAGAVYDPQTKTCSSVACHRDYPPVWGATYMCTQCHSMH